MLQSHGFEVSRYVSLERLVEERREEYYRVLGECSQGWHEEKYEIMPWWNYFLGLEPFTLAGLAAQLPALSRPKAGMVELTGRGRGAQWERK